ncbi:MAG: hypothetical protein ACPG4T_00505 [Nannocystaceae bacterium]
MTLHTGDHHLKRVGATLLYLYQHKVRTTLARWMRIPDATDTFPGELWRQFFMIQHEARTALHAIGRGYDFVFDDLIFNPGHRRRCYVKKTVVRHNFAAIRNFHVYTSNHVMGLRSQYPQIHARVPDLEDWQLELPRRWFA